MNNSLKKQFRKELLRQDILPKELSDITLKYKDLFLLDIQSNKIKLEDVTECQCGSCDLEELAKVDRFGLPFGSFICRECGLVITSPRIKAKSLPYYYDKYYHPLNYGQEHLEEQEALFEVGQGKKIFDILKPFLPDKRRMKILEIGAGTGNVLDELKSEAKKYDIIVDELGTEYSSDCIQKAKRRSINIVYGDIKTIADSNESFDVIILSHVFEHMVELESELDLIKQIMSPNSLLYIEVPGILNLHNKKHYNYSFLGYLIHAHMYNFTMHSLSNILSNFGFEPVYLNNNVESIFKFGCCEKHLNEYSRIINYLELINDPSFFEERVKLQRWHKAEKEKNKKLNRWHQAEKEKNKKLNRWHQAEKEKNKKLNRWHQAEKEKNKKLNRWHQAEKDKILEVTKAYDEFSSVRLYRPLRKIKKMRLLFDYIRGLKVKK